MRVVNALYTVLPPEALERRYDIVEIAVDLMIALITLEKIPLCGVISLLTESGRNRAVKWYIHKRALETKKGIVYETEE